MTIEYPLPDAMLGSLGRGLRATDSKWRYGRVRGEKDTPAEAGVKKCHSGMRLGPTSPRSPEWHTEGAQDLYLARSRSTSRRHQSLASRAAFLPLRSGLLCHTLPLGSVLSGV